ncbi:hypothetical protein B0J11DRAFT_271270 [Dendryphion nanum]|uniref:Knr4/Smi1-like domain-containing protein n=1 Tax=Dendryphion nanum TaxID=256645 RepID=A0A9P9DZT1_9PLEO|nr:hypothetical protein B0J11DRAFT_271270 [Dendryphion nanum]
MSLAFKRKYDRVQILQEKAPWLVARTAFSIALEFALLGHIDIATEIYTLFDDVAPENKAAWCPGLYFAWEALGQWPESVPPQDRLPEALSKLETERMVWKRKTNANDAGIEKLVLAAMADEERIKADDLTVALDLAVSTGRKEKADKILRLFAEYFDQTWKSLSKSRNAWKLLKDKALAVAIGVKEEKISAFKAEVLATFQERRKNGAQRRLKDLSMVDLVKACNESTLKNAIWGEMDIEDPPNTVLQPGATEEDIRALEERIGHNLPTDYKEFLAVSNGLGPVWNGLDAEPRFLGTGEVHLFDATEEQKAWHEASVEVMFITDLSKKIQWATLDRVIQINSGDASSRFVWLVEPEYSQKLVDSFNEVYSTLPEEEQLRIKKRLEVFTPPVDEAKGFADVGWQLFVWEPNTLERTIIWSFREYLEFVTSNASNRDLDEESRLFHTQDVFAYTLR